MTQRILFATLVAAASLFAAPALSQGKAADIPVETFMRRAENTQMTLSPNGQLLAALTPVKGRDNLVVIDLAKRSKTIITSLTDYDVVDFRWINDKRVFFRVADGRDALGRVEYAGTYAIDIDGRDERDLNRLVYGSAPTALERRPTIRPIRRGEGDEMFVGMTQRRREAIDVYALNTRTGRFRLLVEDAPADTTDWVLDWNDVPRVVQSYDPKGPSGALWYRPDEKGAFRKLMDWGPGIGWSEDKMEAIAFTEDNKQIYVSSNVGRDRAAIFRYDPETKKLGEPVYQHPLIDLEEGTPYSNVLFDRPSHKLLGIRYHSDKPGAAWDDEALAKLQKTVDAALPNKHNQLTWGEDNRKRFLVFSRSDVDPGRYYLLNTEPSLTMEEIVAIRPWLKPELMSPVTYMPYKARDGLDIPAWVTIPKGSSGKNLPLVLHVHGGPWARSYGWTPWTRYAENQFFASRGYAVLEAEPRASTGFGRKHLTAGDRQWGLAMQDDLTDGVMALVKAGIVDKSRVCIYGGSYGGYASLWGPIKDPDLYRCAIPWIAVSDLALMQTATWSDTNQTRTHWDPVWKRHIGLARDEKDMLDKVSPYLHADRIKVPMLLVMGGSDRRVPIEHGTRMKDALDKAGVKNEYVIYNLEAHGFNKDENVFDFFKRVEKFLAENLK